MRPFILPHGGYGLGNELMPLGKAYLLAKECNGTLLDISWRDNKRGYKKYFKTSYADPWVRRMLWKFLPRISFPVGHPSHDISGQIKEFCHTHDLYRKNSPCLVTVTGIDGGPQTVYKAKDYILKRLLNTAYTLDNLSRVNSFLEPGKITVGVHIRLGDFYEIGSRSYSGVVNTMLPLQWYVNVIQNLFSNFGKKNLQVLLASDSPLSAEIIEIERLTGCHVISRIENSDVSDLLALSQTDLLICSSSTYSMWAAFIGDPYYIWYKPNMLKTNRGSCLRLAQLHSDLVKDSDDNSMPTAHALSDLSKQGFMPSTAKPHSFRGYPVGDSGEISETLLSSLKARAFERHPSRDLVRGGVLMSYAMN